MNVTADAPFYEAAFNSRLAFRLFAADFGIRRTDRDIELAMKHQNTTQSLGRKRGRLRETGMEFADAFAVVKGELGATSRAAKRGNDAERRGAARQLALADDAGRAGIV